MGFMQAMRFWMVVSMGFLDTSSHVLVHEVAVAVLLGGPLAGPALLPVPSAPVLSLVPSV